MIFKGAVRAAQHVNAARNVRECLLNGSITLEVLTVTMTVLRVCLAVITLPSYFI